MKNAKMFLVFLLAVAQFNQVFAQHVHFPTSGIIEFDKKINTYAFFKKMINKDNEVILQAEFDFYKKNHAQFKILKSELIFLDNKTFFKPIETEDSLDYSHASDPMANQINIIFNDFSKNTSVIQKKVYDELFLIKDKTKRINWKITDEIREIAGYSCRRANAIILDSVYVVAFYTNDILISGGPESFSGLPGMILGVAIPHENVTWFATKVTETNLPQHIIPPSKGKPLNNQQFLIRIQDAFKSWDNRAKFYFKGFLL